MPRVSGHAAATDGIPVLAGMTRLAPIASTLRVLLLDKQTWIPAFAGMTRLFPIASTLCVLLLDIRVT
jgi:hypothetical protein